MCGCEATGLHVEWDLVAGDGPLACNATAEPTFVAVTMQNALFTPDELHFDCDDHEALFEPGFLTGNNFELTIALATAERALHVAHAMDVHYEQDTFVELPKAHFQLLGPGRFTWLIIQESDGAVVPCSAGDAVRVVLTGADGSPRQHDFSCTTQDAQVDVVFGTYQADATLLRFGNPISRTSSVIQAHGSHGFNLGFRFTTP